MLKHLIALTIVSSALANPSRIEINSLSDEVEDDDVMEDQPMDDDEENEGLVPIGDMLLTKEQYDFLYKRDPNKRVGLTNVEKKWPEGVVPIKFKEGDFDEAMKGKVRYAMEYISNVSCIKFKTLFNETEFPNYVLVKYRHGACSSQVGNRQNGSQALNLHERCGKGNIVHELLHSLGFLHMHTAPDRDNFVKIIKENIRPEYFRNFEKTLAPVSMYDTLYDYASLMHYGQYSFQKGSPLVKKYTTILPKEKASDMGQRSKMTDGDITRLNRMYKCPGFEPNEVEVYMESDAPLELSADEVENFNSPEETAESEWSERVETDSNGSHRGIVPADREDTKSEAFQGTLKRRFNQMTREITKLLKPLCQNKESL